jgi:hypothetical protein
MQFARAAAAVAPRHGPCAHPVKSPPRNTYDHSLEGVIGSSSEPSTDEALPRRLRANPHGPSRWGRGLWVR